MEVKMENIPLILMFLFYVAIAVFLSQMIYRFVKAVEKIADGLTKK
jgi:hypothetical protein